MRAEHLHKFDGGVVVDRHVGNHGTAWPLLRQRRLELSNKQVVEIRVAIRAIQVHPQSSILASSLRSAMTRHSIRSNSAVSKTIATDPR